MRYTNPTDRESWSNRAWNDGAPDFYDRGEPDEPSCYECGRTLDADEAECETCPECFEAEENSGDIERLMMAVIEIRTDVGDEALEY